MHVSITYYSYTYTVKTYILLELKTAAAKDITVYQNKQMIYTDRVFCQLETSLTHLFKIITDPQRDGCSPVPVSRYSPISCIFKPVPKTLLPHKIWNPVPEIREVFFYHCIPLKRKLVRMVIFYFVHKTS